MSDQHPSKSGFEQVLQSEQENLLPDTESVPSLPERSPLPSGERPKPGFTPSTRNPNLDTPLPPPPPEPVLNKEADPKTSVESQPAQRTSRNMSQQGDTGAKPENGRASGADFGKRKSGNGDVQVEMDELDDPTLVDIVQGKKRGSKADGSLDGHRVSKLVASKEEMGSYIAKDEDDEDLDEDDVATEFDELDLDDRERQEDAWEESNILSRAIILFQNSITKTLSLLNRLTRGYFWSLLLLIGYIIYFVMAMEHKFGDEGSHRLLGCTIFGVFVLVWPHLKRFVVNTTRKLYGSDTLTEEHTELLRKVRLVLRWVAYFVMTGVMIYVLVDEGRKRPKNMRGLPGIFVFLLVALLFSSRASKINWHTIFWSVALQFICAMFVLKWDQGRKSIVWIQDRFNQFFDNSHEGSQLLFGENWRDHIFVFGALPLLWFANGVFTMLYYCGVMQHVIGSIGSFLQFVTGVSPLEAMSISAGIFMEGYTNLVVMRPFLGSMTKSQLFSVMTGCISSLGGAYLAFLGTLGISLEFIIPAMLVSAPATFAVCKLMVPESRSEEDTEILQGDCQDLCEDERTKYSSLLDAAQSGALSMLGVTANVAVVGYVFMTLITWMNHTFGWFGDRVGVDNLSIEWMSSYALYPVAFFMGVDPDDCRRVAMLLGYRIGIYNIISFFKLTQLKVNKYVYFEYMAATNYTGPITHHSNDDITLDLWAKRLEQGFMSDRSEAIATYSLCGFSSVISSVMVLGVVYALEPKRKKWITSITIQALVAGNLANCMTGCFASLFY